MKWCIYGKSKRSQFNLLSLDHSATKGSCSGLSGKPTLSKTSSPIPVSFLVRQKAFATPSHCTDTSPARSRGHSESQRIESALQLTSSSIFSMRDCSIYAAQEICRGCSSIYSLFGAAKRTWRSASAARKALSTGEYFPSKPAEERSDTCTANLHADLNAGGSPGDLGE